MADSEEMTDEFLKLFQRFMRMRPKLSVFPDDGTAGFTKKIQELKENTGGHHEDRVFLFRILDILAHSETPPTMGELSAHLDLPLSSATRMADDLVRAKLAERCDDPHDRRIVRLCATKSGEQFFQMAANFMKGRITYLLKHFTPEEQAQLLRLMSKLVDSISAERR